MSEKIDNIVKKIIALIGIIFGVYHIVVLNFIPRPAMAFRSFHLLLVLLLTFLIYPTFKPKEGEKKDLGIINLIFIALSIASVGYAYFNIENILLRGGIFTTQLDVIMGLITLLCVLEATRRTNGMALPIIGGVFILYAFLGQYLPGMLGHSGYSVKRIITTLYTYDGVFGTALDTAATFVVMFVIFAAFLEKTGAGAAFFDLASSVAGAARGGPAKVAVIACALFGTISGSAVACVAACGSIIIPLMIKMNYDRTLSAASVSAASIGGQIMPPVMAAGAFLMAEYLGMKYLDIVVAAIIPAVMYFFTIWISIDAIAAKNGLNGLNKDELPKLKAVLKKDWPLFLPLVLLIVLLTVVGYSAIKSAFFAMVACIVVCMFKKETRMSFKSIVETLIVSAKGSASTACACACAGIVIGCISLTGLGLKISSLIIGLSGGNVLPALILSMCTAILFGMGLPTTVSYILCANVLAPVLTSMGIVPLAAHMFIFYFACLSGITPPVALAAYTGAGIAGSKAIQTASEGCKLAIVAFFVPYMFVYNTAFLMNGGILDILWAVLCGIVMCYALTAAIQGYMVKRLGVLLRLAFFVCAVFMFLQFKICDVIGLAIFAVLMALLLLQKKKGNTVSEPAV
ncbi:TRAP transporter fused permease subunit [Oscillibacter sp. MSJ-2]|uniref:TRAP transporter fused permease subunit n=1 Tax=Dysosmobacter acutus TaxID=2841504 RepID=A0ABS6FA05_9FIRM|nr:TRAP transporter fused permease subunit [Dysosmobacter acutus]MBU5627120.1 TRAP transporter fused permease subunit [Dysosmobacter acutus]